MFIGKYTGVHDTQLDNQCPSSLTYDALKMYDAYCWSPSASYHKKQYE